MLSASEGFGRAGGADDDVPAFDHEVLFMVPEGAIVVVDDGERDGRFRVEPDGSIADEIASKELHGEEWMEQARAYLIAQHIHQEAYNRAR